MKLTELQLRQIIRSVIKESYSDDKQACRTWPRKLVRAVQDVIRYEETPTSFPGSCESYAESECDVSPDYVGVVDYSKSHDVYDVVSEFWTCQLEKDVSIDRKTGPIVAHAGWYGIEFRSGSDSLFVCGPFSTRNEAKTWILMHEKNIVS